ncbi:porin [Pseudaminobacter arsenicus]|uniref:Porin n=1 Tax=Borborobacter arsenicus TaxID=1851146 RepID=A0A432V0R2_9HYPH|nr:porin [Pseudaminobacter arsenicus]RUM95773.1 porin [Pseudaminobacter arsenicus]
MRDNAAKSPAITGLILLGIAFSSGSAMADGLKPIEYTFGDGTVIRLSGQINMGVLRYDDGQEVDTNFVDNDNSGTRARLQLFTVRGDWKFESTFEVEYQPLASNDVSQFNHRPNWDFGQRNIRKAEIAFANERFGKIWLGQGSTASDGTAEVDKSGTGIIAYSSIPDTSGGYFFRFQDDGLSDIQVGDAFSNFDGLGRKFRIRYDTPTFNGFGLRTSYGVDWLADDPEGMYDVAATYTGDFDAVALEGAVSWSHNEASDTDLLAASVSGLHKPTGISLTLAAGQEDTDAPSGYYGYAKLGYERDFFDIGSTAFSIDYYLGKDIAAADSESRSFGLAAVQNIDKANLKLWLLWRDHDYDDSNGEYEDGQAVFGGALFRF